MREDITSLFFCVSLDLSSNLGNYSLKAYGVSGSTTKNVTVDLSDTVGIIFLYVASSFDLTSDVAIGRLCNGLKYVNISEFKKGDTITVYNDSGVTSYYRTFKYLSDTSVKFRGTGASGVMILIKNNHLK